MNCRSLISLNLETKKRYPKKIMKRFKKFLFLFLLFLSFDCNRTNKTIPTVVDGTLDLRSWDFAIDGPVNLSGNWNFHWNQFLEPKNEFSKSNSSISVPGQWQKQGYPSKGYSTYALLVLLPDLQNHQLTIAVKEISSSYEFYINGTLVKKKGKIAISKESAETYLQYGDIPIPEFLLSQSKELNILIHASNFEHNQAGIWEPIQIGRTEDLNRQKQSKIVLELIVFGALLIMGLYHFGFFFYRKIEFAAFYFALFCFFMAIRTIIIGDRILLDAFPMIPFIAIYKIEYLTYYVTCFVTLQFISHLFPTANKDKIYWPLSSIFLIGSAIVIVTPLHIFVETLIIVQLATLFEIIYISKLLISAILIRRPGARTFFIGYILFGVTIINDVFRGMGYLYTPPMASYGFLIFVVFQAAILSSRFAEAFNRSEDLTNHLEEKIDERTRALIEAKQEIEEISKFIHIVNSLSTLDEIFYAIAKYVNVHYSISGTWLFLPDKDSEYLYAYKAYSYQGLSQDIHNYLITKKIQLRDKSGGILYKVFQRKKAFYLPRIIKFEYDIDRELANTLSIKAFLHVPIIRRDECVGILCFSNLEKQMPLKANQIRKLTNLCSQISGAIETNHLLGQVHQDRIETESLNELLKSLNENYDIDLIMNKIHQYIKENFNIQYYSLGLIDNERKIATCIKSHYPEFLSEEDAEFSKTISTDIAGPLGGHAFAVLNKKAFYSKRIRKSTLTKEELYFSETMKFENMLIIPLILENEPIGVLDLFNVGRMDLSRETRTKLSILGEQLAGIIYGSKLFKDLQAKTSELKQTLKIIQSDLLTSKKIQENSLMIDKDQLDDLDFIPHYLPMAEVGGDFYAIGKINEKKYRLFLADATGHGVQGAMITMAIKGIYDSIKFYELEVNDILSIFNNEFFQRYASLNSFLTAILVDIDLLNETITFSSAGHPACALLQNGNLQLLPKTGKIIGVSKDNTYQTQTFPFKEGDRLYTYTDGIFEQFNSMNEEFGEARLHQLIQSSANESLTQSLDTIITSLQSFLSGKPLEDDVTIIGLQVKTSKNGN